MSWYGTGTIAITNGSTAVTGTGTEWILNASVGEAILAPDGKLYEIAAINSNTSITLASAYLGTTQSGQTYVVVPTQSYIRDLASQAAALVNSYSNIANNAGAGKFGDGTVAAPGVTFVNDQDTGFFRSASNEVTFVANGVAQFKYGSSGLTILNGNVSGGGAAFTSPSSVSANSTSPALKITQTGTGNALSLLGLNDGPVPVLKFSWEETVVPANDTQIAGIEFDSRDSSNPGVSSYIRALSSTVNGGSLVFGAGVGGAAIERLRVGSTGLISLQNNSGLSISSTAVTAPSASDGNVYSGTYTPTLTNVTNVAASTAYKCQYMRVGNVVTVSGAVSIRPTSSSGDTQLTMSIPVGGSTISGTRWAGGTFSLFTAALTEPGVICGRSGILGVIFRFQSNSTSDREYNFSFTYSIA